MANEERVAMVLPDGKTVVQVHEDHVEQRKEIGWKVVKPKDKSQSVKKT